jgi:glycosyltransferase involved in cell wall biosynthesis
VTRPREGDVDVVIPVFNGVRYLRQAIESVLAQSLLPRRLVVVDDGSSDGSAELARSFVSAHVELVVLQKPNGGLSSARNRGLSECGSEFVALLDADDVWLPDKLARQVERFRTSPLAKLGVVYCDYDDIDADGLPIPEYPSRKLQRGLRGRVRRRLLHGNLVAGSGSGVLVRRTCFARLGGFDEALPCSEDWEMWLRLASEYTFDYVPEVLVHLRRHGVSMQSSRGRELFLTDLRVLSRQHGSRLDRAAVFAGALRRLASAPSSYLSELLSSQDPNDRALLRQLSLGVPRALFVRLIRGARVARQVRARGRAHFA